MLNVGVHANDGSDMWIESRWLDFDGPIGEGRGEDDDVEFFWCGGAGGNLRTEGVSCPSSIVAG